MDGPEENSWDTRRQRRIHIVNSVTDESETFPPKTSNPLINHETTAQNFELITIKCK